MHRPSPPTPPQTPPHLHTIFRLSDSHHYSPTSPSSSSESTLSASGEARARLAVRFFRPLGRKLGSRQWVAQQGHPGSQHGLGARLHQVPSVMSIGHAGRGGREAPQWARSIAHVPRFVRGPREVQRGPPECWERWESRAGTSSVPF